MRVRIVERGKSGGSDNVLYYLTPETITLVPQKGNGAAPAAERHALRGEASPFPNKNVPQATPEVKQRAAAARNRLAVRQARAGLSVDTARQVEDLRAQGELEKADELLKRSQRYLSRLTSLERWAEEFGVSSAQFEERFQRWQEEYVLAVERYRPDGEQGLTLLAGEKELAAWGEALLREGIVPSGELLAAMGLTEGRARSAGTVYNAGTGPVDAMDRALRSGGNRDTMWAENLEQGVRHSVGEEIERTSRDPNSGNGRGGAFRRVPGDRARNTETLGREGYQSRNFGGLEVWYKTPSRVTAAAEETEQICRELGLRTVIVEGIVFYDDGTSLVAVAHSGVTMPDGTVCINNGVSAERAGAHTAYHELFHSSYVTGGRAADQYLQTVIQNDIEESESSLKLMARILNGYIIPLQGNGTSLSPEEKMRLAEEHQAQIMNEFAAFVSGELAAPAQGLDLHAMFRDYEAVRAAWEEMVASARTIF